MNSILQKQIEATFLQLLNDLSEEKQLDIFLKDFLTEKELEDLSKRLAIAYWIQKKRDKQNIIKNLMVTNTDIQNVQDLMRTEGLRLGIKNLEAEEWANIWNEKIKKIKLK